MSFQKFRDGSWRSRAVSAADAVRKIESGHRVFVHGAAATPLALLDSLADRADLENVELYHLHLAGPCRFADRSHAGRLHSISLFTGPGLRESVAEGRADFLPIFLSDIPDLFRTRQVPLDVALVQLSSPDAHGFCTLGTSVDAARAAVDSARLIVAEINEQMPRTHGHSTVRFDKLAAFTLVDRPLPEAEPNPEGEVEARIGEIIAGLVDDGSTLQMGIGAIPDAVLARLGGKHDLGVHTEMFSDRVVDLVENGVITNRFKKVHAGRITTSFVNGSRKLYEFVADNPTVEFHPCDRTNDTSLIRQNPKVVAINSALEIDLTGQICADSIGHAIYSGIGGQMDFIHGAALSPGGKPIIALPSTAAKGKVSRIALSLKPGAGVVTTRGHAHWVVTEYGAVNLHGKTLRQRGEALISIAHPDFRADLAKELAAVRHYVVSR
ncbi:MAG: acetyl-CoA hydrolase/transferase C-terminal domain-containing protein [Polyangiaceae bacterium]